MYQASWLDTIFKLQQMYTTMHRIKFVYLLALDKPCKKWSPCTFIVPHQSHYSPALVPLQSHPWDHTPKLIVSVNICCLLDFWREIWPPPYSIPSVLTLVCSTSADWLPVQVKMVFTRCSLSVLEARLPLVLRAPKISVHYDPCNRVKLAIEHGFASIFYSFSSIS